LEETVSHCWWLTMFLSTAKEPMPLMLRLLSTLFLMAVVLVVVAALLLAVDAGSVAWLVRE
jgi:hypothetical protein